MSSEVEMKLKCPGCEIKYKLGPANTVVHCFSDRMYCSYLESTCPRPQCEEEVKNFMETEDIVACIKAGWPLVPRGCAPQDVLDQYLEIADITLVEPVELTPRLESQMDVLHWELEGVITPQDIMDVPIDTRTMRTWK